MQSIQLQFACCEEIQTPPTVKTTRINNRRYLGNKYKLLPFIKSVVDSECSEISSVADIFAGTGAVASAFTDKQIITNDILYSNYICHVAWFSPLEFSPAKILELITYYNQLEITQDNYMSENFADTFFSLEDCRKIGFIREDIDKKFIACEINERERALLITSLLYGADKIANTCGHYDAYRKGAYFERHLQLSVPMPTGKLNPNNTCYNEDTNNLIRRISADLVYIDPPYNSRQYCDAYHLLENIAKWEKPEVFGVARKMDRTALKSNYNTNKATSAFENLIKNINAKYILFSYNNMANKGNDRSNAKIADKDIMRILSEKGKVKVFTQEYKAFSTGKSDISDNEERLFLCICKQKAEDFIQSPLNYTGGKCKLLPQIMPLFPNKIDTFVDLFCGGCNVGVNVVADKVIFNDINHELYHLYITFKNLDKRKILSDIENIIDDYQLSQSDKYGYTHYNCNSSDGLGEYNRDKFLKLRDDFNNKTGIYEHSLMLYVLIVYAFNNQIRFNSKGEFNLPVGKRDFNPKMKSKLCNFIDKIQETDFSFSNKHFRDVDLSELTEKSLVYCDPPYLITCASYNERDGWNEQDERELLDFLDRLNEKKIKFALSNVLTSKGKTNTILLDWTDKNNYRVTHLNCDYSNSNYQVKDRTAVADEVLITNY